MISLRKYAIAGVLVGTALYATMRADAQSTPVLTLSPINFTKNQTFNMTTEGTTDWIVWAGANPNSMYRDAFGGQAISTWSYYGPSSTPLFDPSGSDNNNVSFLWANGSPQLAGASTGFVYLYCPYGSTSQNTGFLVTVPCAGSSGKVRLWLNLYQAAGYMAAALKDPQGNYPTFKVDLSFDNPGTFAYGATMGTGYYDITYSNTIPGDVIELRYKLRTDYGQIGGGGFGDGTPGFIGLEAIALSGNGIVTIPEPATLGLLGIVAVSSLIRRRRST